MINRLVALALLLFITLSSILLFFVALLIWLCTALFDRRLVLLHLFTSVWGALYLWIMPAWSVSISGREKFDRSKTYIIVSNHQSQLDILCAFMLFRHFKWVSKIEVFRIPFIGWNMRLNRYISLRRGDKESVIRMLHQCEATLAAGSSVYIFPEGTRSPSGRVREFKTGAFTLALNRRLPILPIVINGSKNALPKHSLNFHGRHHIRLEVLDEMPYESFAHLNAEQLAEKTRRLIIAHVDEHRS